MAYVSHSTDQNDTYFDTSDLVIPYPTGIVAGELLVAGWVGIRSASGFSPSFAAGWTSFYNPAPFPATNPGRPYMFFKKADGTESGTSVTLGSIPGVTSLHFGFIARFDDQVENPLAGLLQADFLTSNGDKTASLDDGGGTVGESLDRVVIGAWFFRNNTSSSGVLAGPDPTLTTAFTFTQTTNGAAVRYHWFRLATATVAAGVVNPAPVMTFDVTPNTNSAFYGDEYDFVELSAPAAAPPRGSRVELPRTRMKLTVFPNRLNQATLHELT